MERAAVHELPAFRFLYSTRQIDFGIDRVDTVGGLVAEAACRRVAVVLDGFFLGGAVEARLAETLAGLEPVFIGVPRHEPDADSVERVRAALAEVAPDCIIAVGGGSALDTAKVARMLLGNPGPIEAIAGPVGVRMAPHPSLFVCIPTTAGTGSEISESAVIARAGADYKMIFRSPEMSADRVVLDPSLTVSAPPEVTAASGYDAVTHAVEAYTSRCASPLTDPFALAAMEHLAAALPRACTAPDDLVARGRCLIGSLQAGIAFNSANLGLAHALSGALGALHHVPHGLANALALPWTMAYNQPVLGEKGERISGIFGGATAAEGLSRLRHRLGLDRSLDEFVTTDEARDALALGASKSGQVRMNPRQSTVDDLRRIVEAMRRPTHGEPPCW